MKRVLMALVVGLVGCTLTCGDIWAQATAQIEGTVKDQSGAVLPGVEITATQTDTGIARNTISNETGSFVLPNLAIGPYRFEASLPGFRTFAQTGIVLQVNSNPVINVVLEVGQVTEQVEVQANAAMVETRAVGVGTVIENERILELPLNGRNVTELITLAGGAVQQGTTNNRSFEGSPIISAAGGVGYGTGYNLDGIQHLNPYDGQAQPLPFPDALQEFKVESSGLSAQNSRASAVNSVTKSGTNEFHGTLFEFVRNDLFNARQYFATTKSTLKRNQFGGTIGGPIVRNKVFFFAGVQATTLRQDPSNIRQFVPTAAMLAGDFTAVTAPACNNGRQIALRAPFVNNRVDPALLSRPAVTISGKLPKSEDPCGLVTFGRARRQNYGQVVTRADYQKSSNHSIFGRYVMDNSRIVNAYVFDPSNILNTGGAGYNNYSTAYAFGDTYLMGPNMVNAFRLAVNRVNIQRVGAEFFEAKDVGINIYSAVPKFMILGVTGGFNIGGGSGTASPGTFRTNFYQMADDVSLVRGTHQFAFGGYGSLARSNTYAHVLSPGNFSFNGNELGLGLADFLLGRPNQFQHRNPNPTHTEQWNVSAYVQDTWKANPKLTVNYGVRWQPLIPQALTDGLIYLFDYDKFQQGIKSTVFRNAPAGFTYPGDAGFPGKLTNYHAKWNVFGPRLGLAWDPRGDGRTSLRASYSISYEDLPLDMRISTPGSPPWGNTVRINSPTGGLENPYRDFPGGSPFPSVFNPNSPFIAFGDFISPQEHMKPITTSSWNLSLQRQVGSDWLVSASYLGNRSLHLWTGKALNPSIYFPGNPVNGVCTSGDYVFRTTASPCSTTANTNQRRKLNLERPQDGGFIANLNQYDTGGTQSYHGLLASIQRRVANGINIDANYTLSHCIGDQRRGNSGDGFDATESYQDPNNRRLDRGNCASDRRQIFNLTSVAETPQFSNPTMRMIATGWRVSGILRMSTGASLDVQSGSDRALTGILPQRPDQVLGNVYGDGSLRNFLNPAAFAQPALGKIGNMGFQNVKGPGTWQLDAALSRVFQFRESQRLEFRAEAYNLTNSLRKGNPGTVLTSSTFGQINTASDPRILQFALKYIF